MKKKFIALLLGLTLVAALAACGSDSNNNQTQAPTEAPTEAVTEAPTEAGSEEATEAESGEETQAETEEETVELKGTIKIGHLLDVTGTEAITGAIAKKAFDFAAEQLEKRYGYHFEIVDGDCQSDSEKAQTQAESMISQGCKVLFGPTQIGHKKSVLTLVGSGNGVPVTLYNGTPFAFTSGLATGGNSDWVVAEGGGTAGFPTVMADYVYKELGIKKVICFKQDTVGGNNYVDPFVACFTAMGGEVVDNIAVPQPTNDWSSYLITMKNSGAEAIVGWTSSSDAIAFYNEWYNSGTYETMPVIATMHGGFADSYVMDELDEKVVDALIDNGLFAPICYAYSIDSEENKKLVDAWTAEFGEIPLGNNLPGAAYQALQVLCEALDEVGVDASPEEICTAMKAVDFDGPEGHTVFEDGGNTAIKDVYVVQDVRMDDGSVNYQVVETYEQVPVAGFNYDGTNYTGN